MGMFIVTHRTTESFYFGTESGLRMMPIGTPVMMTETAHEARCKVVDGDGRTAWCDREWIEKIR